MLTATPKNNSQLSNTMELPSESLRPSSPDEWVDFGGSDHFRGNEKNVKKGNDKQTEEKSTETTKESNQKKQQTKTDEEAPKAKGNESPKPSVTPAVVSPIQSIPTDEVEETAPAASVAAIGKTIPKPASPPPSPPPPPMQKSCLKNNLDSSSSPTTTTQETSPKEEEEEEEGRVASPTFSDLMDEEMANHSDIRRVSHIVTPPRGDRKEMMNSSTSSRSTRSILLEITAPPDVMQPRPTTTTAASSQGGGSSPSNSPKYGRQRGFGTPPRGNRKMEPSRQSSIAWFKNSRDDGVVHSLTLSEKSQRNLAIHLEKEEEEEVRETVAVFNANTEEGFLTVKALSKTGCKVVAVVRVFTSRNTKSLLRLPRVTVKVADSHDRKALGQAIEGADRAILVTKYWERFENRFEESQAMIVIDACHDVGVPHVVFSTFEDIAQLRWRGRKSQIVAQDDGTIEPSFEGMQEATQKAERLNVTLTHMMTSYLDQEKSKKSLCLLSSGKNGKVIVRPYFKNL